MAIFINSCGGTTNNQINSVKYEIGTYYRIYSKVLGEEREILVNLPFNYKESNTKYPVLYC